MATPRQDSLEDQMCDVISHAERTLGCYDAADWIKRFFSPTAPDPIKKLLADAYRALDASSEHDDLARRIKKIAFAGPTTDPLPETTDAQS